MVNHTGRLAGHFTEPSGRSPASPRRGANAGKREFLYSIKEEFLYSIKEEFLYSIKEEFLYSIKEKVRTAVLKIGADFDPLPRDASVSRALKIG